MADICRFENVYKSISKISVLENVTLSVPEGSVYCIIGDRLSGKDFLLKMMAGLEQPTEGTVTPIESTYGLMVNNCGILPYFSVREHFEIKRRALGIKDPSIVDQTMRDFKLDRISEIKAGKLVLELQCRLMLALALMGNPKVLLLEEPFQNMNFQEITETKQRLLSYRDTYQATIVIATENAKEMTGFATHIVKLNEGRSSAETAVADIDRSIPGYIRLSATPLEEAKKTLNEMGIYSYQTKSDHVLFIFERFSDAELIKSTLEQHFITVDECRVVYDSIDPTDRTLRY